MIVVPSKRRRRRSPPPATTMPSQEGVSPSRWSSKLWSQVCTPRNRSLQVGIKALLVHFCIRAAAARRRGESDKRGPNSCVWALSTAAPHQRQRLLNVASSRRGNSYMSSLELVITIARRVLHQQRGGATAAVPWKEEGEVPVVGWGRGHRNCAG